MSSQTEVELKFLVPQDSCKAIAAEMRRRSASLEHRTLAARYLDTPDRRLARAGLAWRLRREGRRWVQTLKAAGTGALERFEDEVVRPGPTHDAAAHAGSRTGDKLVELLRSAEGDGLHVGVRFRTEVRRISRRIRLRGAVVEVAFDQGSLISAESRLRLRELELELVSGSAAAMLAMAERWRKRFGLIYDPRSKAERGDRLAQGSAFTTLRKARAPEYARDASAVEAFGVVLDECLAHLSRNAIGLIDGDPQLRRDHVHQLRVAIRRLRTALRSFEGWVPPAPEPLVADLRALFSRLGQARDRDVLATGIGAELEKVGAPRLTLAGAEAGPDPIAMVRAPEAQRLVLGWVAWRATLAEAPPLVAEPVVAGGEPVPAGLAADRDDAGDAFRKQAAKRLRRWHRRIVKDSDAFEDLEETDLHSLRKRIKRQRYAVELFAPLLRRGRAARYLEPLAALQDRMGGLNDLFAARQRYQGLVNSEPAALFGLGWIAARVAEARRLTKLAMKRFAKARVPRSV